MICLNEQSYEKLLDTNYPQPRTLNKRKSLQIVQLESEKVHAHYDYRKLHVHPTLER